LAAAAGEALGVPAMLSPADALEDGPDELTAILVGLLHWTGAHRNWQKNVWS
jgi:hypothetical protein